MRRHRGVERPDFTAADLAMMDAILDGLGADPESGEAPPEPTSGRAPKARRGGRPEPEPEPGKAPPESTG